MIEKNKKYSENIARLELEKLTCASKMTKSDYKNLSFDLV